MEIPLKTKKIEYDSAISLLGMYPKEFKSGYKRDTVHPCSLQHY
jgi:hypothetical protein